MQQAELDFAGLYKGIQAKLMQSVLTAAFLFVAQRRVFQLVKTVSLLLKAGRLRTVHLNAFRMPLVVDDANRSSSCPEGLGSVTRNAVNPSCPSYVERIDDIQMAESKPAAFTAETQCKKRLCCSLLAKPVASFELRSRKLGLFS